MVYSHQKPITRKFGDIDSSTTMQHIIALKDMDNDVSALIIFIKY